MLKSLRAVAAAGAALLLLTPDTVRSQDVTISPGAGPATAQSLLDLDVTALGAAAKRGLLIPRMTQAQRLQMNTNVPVYAPGVIGAGEEGMWVYQTNDVGTSAHGFYYWDGTQWIFMGYGVGWNQTGNTGTISGTHFLGTIAPPAGSADLVMRTNNIERMRILSGNGFIGIGTAAPVERVHVQNAGMRLFNTVAPGSLLNTAGTIRYGTASPPGTTNNYHYGNVDGTAAVGLTGWGRIENAERRVINAPYTTTSYSCAAPGPIPGTTLLTSGTTPADVAGAAFSAANGTPYPTFHGNRSRVYYLFRASELFSTFNLCTGAITKVELKVIDDDPLTPAPGAAVNTTFRLANIPATANLTTFAALPQGSANTQPTAAAQPPLVGCAPGCTLPVFHSAIQSLVVRQGWLVFDIGVSNWATGTLMPSFNYTGGDLLIEITMTRGNAGLSPRFEMQTALGFNCTRYAYGTGGVTQGYLVLDGTYPTAGLTQDRPIFKFTGQVGAPFLTMSSGDYIQYDGALLIGRNPWVAGVNDYLRGPGVIGAQFAVYDGNTQLSDHVFDRYFDGAVRPEDEESAAAYAFVELDQLKDFLATERRLPNMPSRQEWSERGAPSLGQLGTRLWQTVEDQALYIAELEKELSALEDRLLAKASEPAGLEAAIAGVRESRLLTPDDQQRLIALMRQRSEQTNR